MVSYFIQWAINCYYHYLFWWSNCPRFAQWDGGGHGNPLQYSCLDNPMIIQAPQRSLVVQSLWYRPQFTWSCRVTDSPFKLTSVSFRYIHIGIWVHWLFGTIGYPRLICYFPCSGPGIRHFSKKCWFILGQDPHPPGSNAWWYKVELM